MFGREAELDELTALTSQAVLIVGDSGIGKSRLLEAGLARLAESSTRPEVICSTRVQLTRRPGALQGALLEALGLAVTMAEAAEGPARRWERIFRDTLAQVAQNRVRDMVAGAHGYMLGIIRARLGDPVADLIAEVGDQLSLSAADRLSNQIAAASDPDALQAFKELAFCASSLTDGPLVLALDAVERISDDDFRMLLDLVEDLPQGVFLLMAHASRAADDLARIRQLDEVGSKATVAAAGNDDDPAPRALRVVSLAPLPTPVVAGWMEHVGLNWRAAESLLEDVLHTTGGYPLYVDQALRALAAGRDLGTVSGEDAFVSRSQQNYAALQLDEQQVVTLLSAFTDPPDLPIVLEVTGLDEVRWTVMERRLVEARVLVTSVRGRPWFHELGRRAIWTSILSSHQRGASATVAANAILASADAAGSSSIQDCMDLARLSRDAPNVASAHEALAEALDLVSEELALLAAMVELEEDGNQGALSLDHLVRHARHRFGFSGPVGTVVRDLEDKRLVVTAENDDVVIALPVWRSPAAKMAVIGRIATDLGRGPIQSLASTLFEEYVRPLLGEFHAGSFGVGSPSVTELGRTLGQMEYDRAVEAGVEHVSRHDRPGLVIRPRLGDLRLYGAVNFPSTELRDAARHQLASLPDDVHGLGEPLRFEVILPWPAEGDPLPALRFTRAAKLAIGEDFKNASHFTKAKSLPPMSTVAAELELELDAWRIVRELSSPTERLAMDIDQPYGLVLVGDETQAWVGEVRGADDLIDLGPPPGTLTSKRMFLQLEELAGLRDDRHISRVRYRGGTPSNPVPSVLSATHKRLQAFNKAQRIGYRLQIPDDVGLLSAMLNRAHQQRYDDAIALVDAGILPQDSDRRFGREVFAIIRRERPGDRLRGFEHSLETLSIPSESAPGEVYLMITDEPSLSVGFPDVEEFGRWFHIPEFDPMRATRTSGRLNGALADALGYDEVRLPQSYWT
ncbi:AAA family ATPase [Nocardioides sp. JQ2195]|nr:AAA family ATPase [Nocardioides sp. JQ2195]QIX27066.1 AAA family ATPase [Nocardioides sp. JQ2195]